MTWIIANALLLAAGVGLAVLARRRGWQPSLLAALAVGAVLRIAVLAMAARYPFQPFDFANDFPTAAQSVLAHQDPTLSARMVNVWHFFPLISYVLAGQLALAKALGLSWLVIGRLVPVAADLMLIWIVGRLSPKDAALRRFEYACLPIAVLVSALHAQIEPLALAFGLGAFVVARRRRAAAAGGLLGLSVATNTWPVLLGPGLLRAFTRARQRVLVVAGAAGALALVLASMPLTFGTPLSDLPRAALAGLEYRGVIGDWSWTAVLMRGQEAVVYGTASRLATAVVAAAVVAAWVWWRRAHPLDLTLAVLLAFLVATPRFGAQYLLFAAPLLVARPTRWSRPALLVGSAWAAVGYLFLISPAQAVSAHVYWALSSVIVVLVLLAALPWDRRREPDAGCSPAVPPGGGWRRPPATLLRYTAGSVVAAVCSEATFLLVYGPLHGGTTVASVLAWLAGAIPNFWLNRNWAWRQRGPASLSREVLPYVVIVLATLAVAAGATALAARTVPHLTTDRSVQVLLVGGTYLAVYGTVFLLRFVLFDRLWRPRRPEPDRPPTAAGAPSLPR